MQDQENPGKAAKSHFADNKFTEGWHGRRYSPEIIQSFFELQDRLKKLRRDPDGTPIRDAEWSLYIYLAIATAEGRTVDITALTADSGMSRSTVKRALDTLERRKEVELSRAPNDKRRTFVHPADKLDDRLDILCDMIDATLEFVRATKHLRYDKTPSPDGGHQD